MRRENIYGTTMIDLVAEHIGIQPGSLSDGSDAGKIRGVTFALISIWPILLNTLTVSPLRMPRVLASTGFIQISCGQTCCKTSILP